MEILDYYPIFAVIFYVGFFILIGVITAKPYLEKNPIVFGLSQKKEIDDLLKIEETDLADEIWKASKEAEKDYQRQEEISFILCGFAIISLVFLISTFEDLASVEIILGLFSFAFIFEIISAFLYHHMSSNYYSFAGMVFQYGGLFAILSGFHAFFLGEMSWSLILNGVYIFGMIVFIILSAKEIFIMNEYSRESK